MPAYEITVFAIFAVRDGPRAAGQTVDEWMRSGSGRAVQPLPGYSGCVSASAPFRTLADRIEVAERVAMREFADSLRTLDVSVVAAFVGQVDAIERPTATGLAVT